MRTLSNKTPVSFSQRLEDLEPECTMSIIIILHTQLPEQKHKKGHGLFLVFADLRHSFFHRSLRTDFLF